jgi:hypothetical protein
MLRGCSLTKNTPRLANMEMAYNNGWPTSLRLNLGGAASTMMHGRSERRGERTKSKKPGGSKQVVELCSKVLLFPKVVASLLPSTRHHLA